MDTKSKKWKSRLSFLVFIIGVSLAISGVCMLAGRLAENTRYDNRFSAAAQKDYQETRAFRDFIDTRLENLLHMANGTYGNYLYSDSYYSTSADSYTSESAQEIVYSSEELNDMELNDPEMYQEIMDERGYGYNGDVTTLSPEQCKQQAEKFHERIKENKNVLYQVSKANQVLYTNMDSVYNQGNPLPDGYNYMMYFDGEKVTIQKDGKDQDVYGDGVYRENEGHDVPGYKNYTVDDSLKDVTIYMMVEKEPVSYQKIGSTKNTYSYTSNVYDIAKSVEYDYKMFECAVVMTVIGLLLSVISILLRKEIAKEKESISCIQRKIWIEAKLLIIILAGASIWKMISGWLSYYYPTDFWSSYVYDIGYTEAISEVGYPLLTSVMSHPVTLLAVFWVLFFLVLDIKKNHKQKQAGLIFKIIETLETKSLSLTITKRQMRRMTLMFGVLAAGIVFGVVMSILRIKEDISTTCLSICYAADGVLCFLIAAWYAKKVKEQGADFEKLDQKILQISKGNYETGKTEYVSEEFNTADQNLDQIKNGMEYAITEQLKSERMKVDLVANVSHDIKTPLTSIISYVGFLKEEENLPDHVKDYIKILDEKSERLRSMVQDVFAISKATSGQLPVNQETIDFGKLLNQTLADMDESISKSNIAIRAEIKEHEYYIVADGQRMYRVCQNLIQNALKYSLEGSRVYITLKEESEHACAVFMNTSKNEINSDIDFSERFVRGDKSRTDGGSGLGLSIAKSFTEACGGEFFIEVNGDMFIVTIRFQRQKEVSTETM